MRKYAYLKEPRKCNNEQCVYKIMLYQTDGGYCLFEYCDINAVQCSFDLFYDSIEDLYDEWDELIDERGWIDIDDPLPDCQHDAFLPIRVKGRDIGKPEWGNLEILKDGEWEIYG
jgi:hypothetical protein